MGPRDCDPPMEPLLGRICELEEVGAGVTPEAEPFRSLEPPKEAVDPERALFRGAASDIFVFSNAGTGGTGRGGGGSEYSSYRLTNDIPDLYASRRRFRAASDSSFPRRGMGSENSPGTVSPGTFGGSMALGCGERFWLCRSGDRAGGRGADFIDAAVGVESLLEMVGAGTGKRYVLV